MFSLEENRRKHCVLNKACFPALIQSSSYTYLLFFPVNAELLFFSAAAVHDFVDRLISFAAAYFYVSAGCPFSYFCKLQPITMRDKE